MNITHNKYINYTYKHEAIEKEDSRTLDKIAS